jgi:cytochrome c1
MTPSETHVRLSIGWCLLAYLLGMLTVIAIIWKGWL